MSKEYVEQRDNAYWVVDSRVSLDSIVYAFLEGLSPETIATECFPVLSLEQVYGAITFYLANRQQIDEYLEQRRIDYEAKRQASRQADPAFYKRMAEARSKLSVMPKGIQ
jgi:uncharacterized protein (DUF433 family)